MSVQSTAVTLRLMTMQDLPMLHEWLNRPHIVEWWGGEAERPTLEDVERRYIAATLRDVRGNQTEAARILGISRKALWEKRKRYGLE